MRLEGTLFDTDRFSLDVTGRLAGVRAPTTVIIGDEDPFVRIADAEAVARGVGAMPAGPGHLRHMQGAIMSPAASTSG